MKKLFIVKNLAEIAIEFTEILEAERRFDEFPDSTVIIEKDESGIDKLIKSRTHEKIGEIEINNNCVYVKVPFFKPNDHPEVKISKIGESPEKLRSKMDVISENWEEESKS